jgi:spore germination cell wall hydrolase CwlJ-like protein
MNHPEPAGETDAFLKSVDTLARTIYGEARGEPVRGQEAVACVVMNRVARAAERGGWWWGATVAEVCRRPWQFSCWNAGDANRAKIERANEGDREFAICVRIARRAVAGALADPTDGATHYHAEGLAPPWAAGREPAAVIGRHKFYNDVE